LRHLLPGIGRLSDDQQAISLLDCSIHDDLPGTRLVMCRGRLLGQQMALDGHSRRQCSDGDRGQDQRQKSVQPQDQHPADHDSHTDQHDSQRRHVVSSTAY
jgi:hypothetical protein